jgi:hypothetical protein
MYENKKCFYQNYPEKPKKINIKKFYWPEDKVGTTKAVSKLHNNKIKLLFKAHANLIPAELQEAAWQQIELARLKQFYKEFSETKDVKVALKIAKKYSIIRFSAKKYDAIKKKYGNRD